MSCGACELAEDRGHISYYRWKHANIMMAGCQEHLKEVMNALNEFQRKEPESADRKES